MIRLRLKAAGVTQLDRSFVHIRQNIEDISPSFDAVHLQLLAYERQLFDTEGASGRHGPWDRYTQEPKYKALKTAILGNPFPVLQFGPYHRLADSLRDPSSPFHLYRTGPNRLLFGSTLNYLDRLGRGGLNFFGEPAPARRAIDLTPEQNTEITRTILQWIRSVRDEAPGFNAR